jgi:hypothetical protein
LFSKGALHRHCRAPKFQGALVRFGVRFTRRSQCRTKYAATFGAIVEKPATPQFGENVACIASGETSDKQPLVAVRDGQRRIAVAIALSVQ